MDIRPLLNKLLVFRNILSDQLLNALLQEQEPDSEYEAAGQLIAKAEEIGLAGDLIAEYLLYLLSSSDNVFSRTAERFGGQVGSSLLDAACQDVAILRKIFQRDLSALSNPPLKGYEPTRPGSNRALQNIRRFFLPGGRLSDMEAARGLCQHYWQYGYGLLSDFMAFKWNEAENCLVGIHSCDNITFADLIGYERQKEELIVNTESFLQDLPANNVLLYGERGTGKSSSIKALINKFFARGLRLVEVARPQFIHLPKIMGHLKNWGKKFILYLDDLSFEEFEVEYKQLKSTIDGGIEVKPDNVLIYATSNRRNIIKEVWADNEGDELHRSDTINEKVSLADRFGVKIFFISPDQQAYFKIITELAARAGLKMSKEELRQEAVKWEMSHSGRSGRIAEQLVAYLAGRHKAM